MINDDYDFFIFKVFSYALAISALFWERWVYYRGKGLFHACCMYGYHIDYDQAFSTGNIGILIISFIH